MYKAMNIKHLTSFEKQLRQLLGTFWDKDLLWVKLNDDIKRLNYEKNNNLE